MALGELQLIRQNLLRLHVDSTNDACPTSSLEQQLERQQRWAESVSLHKRSWDLCSAVNSVEEHTVDRVFARQVFMRSGCLSTTLVVV